MFLSTTSWRLEIPFTYLDLHHLLSPKPELLVISQSACVQLRDRRHLEMQVNASKMCLMMEEPRFIQSTVTCSNCCSRKQTDNDTCSITEQLVGINLAVCRHPEYLNNELSISLIMLATENQVVLFQLLPIYTVLI